MKRAAATRNGPLRPDRKTTRANRVYYAVEGKLQSLLRGRGEAADVQTRREVCQGLLI